MNTVLVATAIPDDSEQIRTDRFVPIIQQAISKAEQTSNYNIQTALATDKDELIKMIELKKPSILHLIGHGDRLDRFTFEDNGLREYAKPATFSKILQTYADCIECVVLSACFSFELARQINTKIYSCIGFKDFAHLQVAMDHAHWFYFYHATGNSYIDINKKVDAKLMDRHKLSEREKPYMLINDTINKHHSEKLAGKIHDVELFIEQGKIEEAIKSLIVQSRDTKLYSIVTSIHMSYIQYNKDRIAGLNVQGKIEGIMHRLTEALQMFKKNCC